MGNLEWNSVGSSSKIDICLIKFIILHAILGIFQNLGQVNCF